MSQKLFVFCSKDTFIEKISSVPICSVEKSSVESENIKKLNMKQEEVFRNIEKIKASTKNSSANRDLYGIKELEEFLKRFGDFKITGKKNIIAKIVDLYNIRQGGDKHEEEKEEEIIIPGPKKTKKTRKNKFEDFGI